MGSPKWNGADSETSESKAAHAQKGEVVSLPGTKDAAQN